MKALISVSRLGLLAGLIALWSCSGCGASLQQGALPSAEANKLEAFPYDTFHQVLQAHVDTEGRCNYGNLKKDASGLKQFTATVATVGPSSKKTLFPNKEHEIAYYMNAYNSLAMLNALGRHPELKSLEDIKTDFFYLTNVQVDGNKTDLYNLENELVRPLVRSHYVAKGQGSKIGRIHFALNCASSSCPKLPNEVFLPDRVEEQLDRETRRFVAEPRNVSVDAGKKVVTLSRIFDWYKDDFTDDKGNTINPLVWVNKYRAEDQQVDTSYAIAFFEYDWTVNDEKLKR